MKLKGKVFAKRKGARRGRRPGPEEGSGWHEYNQVIMPGGVLMTPTLLYNEYTLIKQETKTQWAFLQILHNLISLTKPNMKFT